jgi:PAS domain S-box-containing protein
MDVQVLNNLIDKAQQRFQDILQRTNRLPAEDLMPKPETSLLAEAIEEVSICLEELQVSIDELQRQNEELFATRIELETERQRYRDLFDFAPDGYLVTDLYGVIQESNRAMATLLNLSQEFLVGKPLSVFVSKSEPKLGLRNFQSLLRKLQQCQEIRGQEIFLQPRQNPAFCAELNVVTILNPAGEAVGLRWLIRDISDRKQVELQLRLLQSKANLAEAQRIAHIGNWEFDPLTRSFTWSEETFRIFSLDPDLPPPTWQEYVQLIDPEDRPLWETTISNAISEHRPYELEFRILRSDGELRDVFAKGNPIFDDSGQAVGLFGIIQDITERKANDRIKDEFISVVSHELRTPLTVMQGGLDLLASGLIEIDSAKGQRMIEVVKQSSDRLVRLVEDILNLERLQSGQDRLSKQFCNIADLMLKVVDSMQAIANLAEITLLTSCQPFQIDVDADRIIQVLTNLLGNAIKFSPAGSTIWLTGELVEANSEASAAMPGLPVSTPLPYFLIAVKDRGCGIPADKLSAIFERFQQVDSSDSRTKEGTGLGLAICRYLVEQHGGQIWVDSILGEGSSFYFTLPVNR